MLASNRRLFTLILFGFGLLCSGDPALCHAEEPLRLRVLSYNIHHGEGVDGQLDLTRVAHVIRSVHPDLVALQEVEQETHRTKMVDQTAELARLTELHGVFARNIEFQGGGYGNAVLSRFPISSTRNVVLPNHRNGEQRGAMIVNIDVPQSQSISFICTHLDHRQDDSERLASAKAIRAELSSSGNRPAILAGDLNATPDSEVFQAFRVDWTLSNMDQRPTIPVDKPTQQIDFVLFRPADKWKVIETKVLSEAVASDHRAIFAELELHSDQ